MERGSTLLPSTRLKLIGEKLVQPKNRAVSGDDVCKAVELVANRVRDSDLVEPLFDEVAEEVGESWS